LVHCISDSGILLFYVRLWLDLWVTAKEELSSRVSVQKAFEHYCSLFYSRNHLDRARNYLGGGQTPVRAIAEAFTIRYIQPLWFIWVIIAAYIMFYAVFRHTEINVGAYGFTSITIAYILISAFVNPRDEMYASIIGMPLGILWAVYERKIDSYFEICYLRKEIVAIAAFVILFIGRLVLSVAGLDNQLLQSVLRNIITIAFIVPLVGLLKNVRIQKRFLIWLGTISYEIYIIHPFILYFFEKETTEGKQVGNLEIVLWTIGLTLFLSSVLKVVQDILVRKVRS
jgi:peptidoglycan/LPS O-acetylase OafA/YrhL